MRLTKQRRKELEEFWNAYHGVQLYIIVRYEGKDVLYRAEGGMSVGLADLKKL